MDHRRVQGGLNQPSKRRLTILFFNRIFRERALQRRARPEPLDDRLQITAPHEWLIVAALGVMFLVLLGYGAFVRVERTLFYEAALVLPGERHYLVAPASGTVLDVLVEVSDSVPPGQAIANVRTSTLQHWESAISGIINSLGEGGEMTEDDRVELLRTLLAAESVAMSASEAEVISPYGGEVIALDLAPGQAVSAGASVGLVRADSEGYPEVVAFVSPNDAERLRPGMEAHVSIRGAGDGNAHVVSGHVANVSARVQPPPKWLLDQGMVVPQQPHELRWRWTVSRRTFRWPMGPAYLCG